MKYWARDSLIIVILIAGLSSSGFFLYKEIRTAVVKTGGDEIGKVLSISNAIERKYSENSIWENLKADQILYNYDSIRSESGSAAVLEFKDGTQIKIDENTMLTLNWGAGEKSIELQGGNISASTTSSVGTTGAKSSAFNIISGDKVLSVTSGNVNVSRSAGGDMAVSVKDGDASLTSAGKTAVLKKNQEVELKHGSESIDVKQIEVRPIEPINEYSAVSLSSEAVLVKFKWEQLSESDTLLLQISSKRNFADSKDLDVQGKSTAAVNLAEGLYYWRLAATRNEAVSYSQISRLSVNYENLPELLSPPKGKIFNYRSTLPVIKMSWDDSRYAESYLMEVSRDDQFTQIIVSKNLKDNSFVLNDLQEGAYYWRVRGYYTSGINGYGKSAGTGRFSVIKNAVPSAPVQIYPQNDQVFKLPDVKNGIRFSWQEDLELQNYVLKIYKDTSLIEEITGTSVSHISKKITSTGVYRWTVDGVDFEGNIVKSQTSRLLKIEELKGNIELVYPLDNANIEINEFTALTFKWKSTDYGQLRFRLYKDSLNSYPLYNEVTETNTRTLVIPQSGKYIWQVVSEDESGNEIFASSPASFNVYNPVGKPDILYPAQDQNITASGNTPLEMTWSWVRDAEYYNATLLDSKGNVIAESRNNRALNWKIQDLKAVKSGPYILQVQAFAKNPLDETSYRAGGISKQDFVLDRGVIYRGAVLNYPENGYVINQDQINEGIEFRWQQQKELAYAYLDISRSSDFKKIEQSIYAESSSGLIEGLNPGKYYWRIRLFDSKGVPAPDSLSYNFSVTASDVKSPASLIKPEQGSLFNIKQEIDGINFEWTSDIKYGSYRLQICSNSDFTKNTVDDVLYANRQIVKNILDVGTWYWRIGSIRDDDKTVEIYSKTQSFRIGEVSGVLKTLYPASSSSVETNAEGILTLKWNTDMEGPFRVSIYEKGNNLPVYEKNTSLNTVDMFIPGSGLYSWQIRAIDSKGNVLKSSDKAEFTLTSDFKRAADTAPVDNEPVFKIDLKTPAENSTYQLLDIFDTGINFSWSKAPNDQYLYWVEIAKDKAFDSIYSVNKSSTVSRQLTVKDAGVYFWRVRAENVQTRNSVISESSSFVVQGQVRPAQPVILSPAANETLYMDNAGALLIRWQPVKEASYYNLMVYKTNGKLVFEVENQKSTEYSYKQLDKLDVGDFYLILTAVSDSKVRAESEPLRVNFSLALKKSIQAPKILSPETQYAD